MVCKKQCTQQSATALNECTLLPTMLVIWFIFLHAPLPLHVDCWMCFNINKLQNNLIIYYYNPFLPLFKAHNETTKEQFRTQISQINYKSKFSNYYYLHRGERFLHVVLIFKICVQTYSNIFHIFLSKLCVLQKTQIK